jgi:flagellin
MDFLATDFSDNSASITNVVNPAPAADQVEIGGVTFTATTGATGGQNFNVSGNNTADMEELAQAISDYNWGDTAFTATVSNGVLNLSKTVDGAAADVAAGDFSAAGVVSGGTANMTLVEDETSDELTSLIAQYNTIRTQMTELAADAGYKGKNLLAGANLVVKFEGASLTVEGFSASAGDLDIVEAAWTNEASINGSITELEHALDQLRLESSKMSGNLSIITVRQSFSQNMMNTLNAGSDLLTLADSNEEGANMLMLQTRQSLSTTALSLSAQAAQSVLKLFG